MKSLVLLVVSVLTLLTVSPALAARPSVTVISPDNGRFSLQGAAMDGVAGMELVISYNSAALGVPTVVQGPLIAGAMMAANTTVAGVIKVAVVSTAGFRGAGEILSLSFSNRQTAGGVNSITARMIDLKGATLASTATVAAPADTTGDSEFSSSPGVPFTPSPQVSPTGNTAIQTAQPSVSAGTVAMGTLTLSTEPTPATQPAPSPREAEKPLAEPSRSQESIPASPVPEPETPAPAKKQEEIRHVSVTGLLERFRSYNGELSLQSLSALFLKPPSALFVQEPYIAVSDGAAVAVIHADLSGQDESRAPNFALSEAKLKALKMSDRPGFWSIEILPEKGSWSAAVTVLAGSTITEVPVTVVPEVRGVSFTAAASADFFKDSGAPKPKYDLNADGKHDYVDDYIYVAHALLNKKAEGAKEGQQETSK